jgi:hypothetical protein
VVNTSDCPTFFHEALSSNLPEHEKSLERLAQVILILVAAEAETTAKALTYISPSTYWKIP